MAGTVKAPASNSPRPRARYSSWMLDEPQPRAWLAAQMSQRQASRIASSRLKTASKTRPSIWSRRSASGSLTSSRSPSIRATAPSWSSRADALSTVMPAMLAEGRHQGERQEWRHRQADQRGQHIPVSGGALVGNSATPQALRPGQHGAQPEHVQRRGHQHDPDGEWPDRARTEGQRATGRARTAQLQADHEDGERQRRRRNGEVDEQRAGDPAN